MASTSRTYVNPEMYRTITTYLFPNHRSSDPSSRTIPEPILGTQTVIYYGPVTKRGDKPRDGAIGVEVYKDGSWYEGKYNNFGNKNGYGVLYRNNGAKAYEGGYLNGKRGGYGVEYEGDGSTVKRPATATSTPSPRTPPPDYVAWRDNGRIEGWWKQQQTQYSSSSALKDEGAEHQQQPPLSQSTSTPAPNYPTIPMFSNAVTDCPEMYHTITMHLFPNHHSSDPSSRTIPEPILGKYNSYGNSTALHCYYGPTNEDRNRPLVGDDAIGVDVYMDGSWYEGSFTNDGRRHGYGVFYRRDGSRCYEGEYKEGKRDGYGVEYERDGTTKTKDGWWQGSIYRGPATPHTASPPVAPRQEYSKWRAAGRIEGWWNRRVGQQQQQQQQQSSPPAQRNGNGDEECQQQISQLQEQLRERQQQTQQQQQQIAQLQQQQEQQQQVAQLQQQAIQELEQLLQQQQQRIAQLKQRQQLQLS